MPFIHPVARLISAIEFVIAIIFASTLIPLVVVYLLVFLSILATGCFRQHLRFVLVVTAPILCALIVVWGAILSPDKVPPGHINGIGYAIFSWLRIVTFGGVLQALLLPLVEHPIDLKIFLERNGLSGSLGTLVLASVIFIPEVQRRMGRVVDARRAQGFVVSGFSGLRQLPEMLMPLVASLLDSASKRAELWSHRGLFLRRSNVISNLKWRLWQTMSALLLATTAIAVSILL